MSADNSMGIQKSRKQSSESRSDLELQAAAAIDQAIEIADLGGARLPAHAIAQTLLESEPALFEALHSAWILDRLAWMIARRRRMRMDEKNPRQLVLDDPLFKNLPSRIFLRNGERPRLDRCNLAEIEDHLKILRERFSHHPRVAQMEAVAEKMRRYARSQRGMTWSEVKQRIADELNDPGV